MDNLVNPNDPFDHSALDEAIRCGHDYAFSFVKVSGHHVGRCIHCGDMLRGEDADKALAALIEKETSVASQR